VLAERARDESVVGGIVDRGVEYPGESQKSRPLVQLVPVLAPHRDFDHHRNGGRNQVVVTVDVMPRVHVCILVALHRPAGLLCALAVLAATPVQAQPATRGAAAMASDLRAASRQLEALAERVGRSVVEIFTLGYASSDLADAERGLLVAPSRGSGSGVIVDP